MVLKAEARTVTALMNSKSQAQTRQIMIAAYRRAGLGDPFQAPVHEPMPVHPPLESITKDLDDLRTALLNQVQITQAIADTMKAVPQSNTFETLSFAFTEAQKANVEAMSALTGAIARVEQRVEAWENHYLPHIIDRIPVYVPTEEERVMRDQETPAGSPERVSSSTRPMPMHKTHQDVMEVEPSPLAVMQENSLRNQCARVVQGDTTGTAVLPFGLASEGKGMTHIVRMCAVSVCGMYAPLPKKLNLLLSLPFECFVLSEVRVPSSSVRSLSLSRVASSLGFSSVFSPSPPPSPSFACSPGGTAIFARHEFALHEECVPSLRRWRALGRIVVASIRGHLGEKYVLVACYGFPVSHPQRGANEVLLSDALAYLSSLTFPSFLAGDLNDSVHTSPILSMASAIGVHDLTPNLPTTMKKDGQIANVPPLDHVMANR